MTSSFEVDVNCPYCFDDIVAALREQPTVTEVSASLGVGCVSVTHDTDEAHLRAVDLAVDAYCFVLSYAKNPLKVNHMAAEVEVDSNYLPAPRVFSCGRRPRPSSAK